ncbi:MAG: PHP domain-containing protein [Clostridia bacterium]|nr:PHP domain-containing protein [Clostridia bacterium]
MKKYKVEGHLHIKGNSWCARTEPKDIVKIYKEKGYDAIIVTNHFNVCLYNDYFNGTDEEKLDQFFKSYEEIKDNAQGLKIYFGVEFALGEDHYNLPLKKKCVELLVYGITPQEFREYGIKIINMSYAELKALATEMGWLIFQAHPFRERTKRVPIDCIDGVETYNGNPRHINRNLTAQAYRARHHLLEVVGSDFHVPHDVSSAMMFYELPEDEKELVKVLKEHKFDTLKGKRAIRKA